MSYRTHDIDVRGGKLRVGEWAPDSPAAPAVLAVHGIERGAATVAREVRRAV